MDIIIGGTAPVKMDPSDENAISPASKKQKFRKDRRKNRQDRRASVREGVIVSLSAKKDRRAIRDRRKAGS